MITGFGRGQCAFPREACSDENRHLVRSTVDDAFDCFHPSSDLVVVIRLTTAIDATPIR